MVLIVFGLGDADGFFKVVVGRCGVENLVAVIFEVRWFAATGDAGPSVEEEGFRWPALVLGISSFDLPLSRIAGNLTSNRAAPDGRSKRIRPNNHPILRPNSILYNGFNLITDLVR